LNPGIYSSEELSLEAYHASDGVSNSGLTQIGRSPLHYWAKYMDPERRPQEESAARIVGRALHCLLGEPDKFDNQFCLTPKIEDHPHAVKTIDDIASLADKKGISLPKGSKTKMFEALKEKLPEVVLWDEFKDQCTAGKAVLNPDQWDQVHRMRDAAMKHPSVKVLLAKGSFEQSFYWMHPTFGVLCKCRPDFLTADGVVIDFKTAEDASPDGFKASAWRYRYHVQAAFCVEGVSAHQSAAGPFINLVIEKEPPYAVAVYEQDSETLAPGASEVNRNLELYAQCLRTNTWPGYSPLIVPLGAPAWARKAAV
jgi:exodeoxyribonuclease VIII